MTYHTPSFSSEEGRSIPYVFLSTSKSTSNPPLLSSSSSSSMPGMSSNSTQKLRVWMQGGVHGNEPGGDQALLAFLGKLDDDPEWALSLLENIDLVVLPRYSPDGVAYFQRYLASSYDPNRDHTKMYSQQTRDIKKLNRQFNAHVSVDCHEYSATNQLGDEGQYRPSQDIQFSAFKNPNLHPNLTALGESLFVPKVHETIEENNFTTSGYVVAVDPKGIHLTDFVTDVRGDVAVVLGQGLSFLTETRGIRLGNQHFRRRVAAGLVAVETVMQIAADNAEMIYETVEKARADFITNDREIIVTDYPRWTNKTWPFIEAATGAIVDVPVLWGNNTPPASNLTRARPEAYVFSRAWSHAAALLRDTGLQVDELLADYTGELEAFNITSATMAPSKYEGTVLTTVTTDMTVKNVSFPAGAYWVSTRQQNAAQAFVRLEPEGADSYATFNIFPVSAGDEYQVYRVPA
jgi:hypothetical protein